MLQARILNRLSELVDFSALYFCATGREVEMLYLTQSQVIGYFDAEGRMLAGFVMPGPLGQATAPLCMWAMASVGRRTRLELWVIALRARLAARAGRGLFRTLWRAACAVFPSRSVTPLRLEGLQLI